MARWAVRIAQVAPDDLPEPPEPPAVSEFRAATAAGAACAPGGGDAARMFCLDPEWDYLNHGSYGATFRWASVARVARVALGVQVPGDAWRPRARRVAPERSEARGAGRARGGGMQ